MGERRKKGAKKKMVQGDKNSKVVTIQLNVSLIALQVNKLKSPMKKQDCQIALTNQQLCIAYKRYTLNLKM